jgi:hypothetical protein
MASQNSDYYTAHAAGGVTPALHARARQTAVNRTRRTFRCSFPGLATETSGEYVNLAVLGVPSAKIVPESLRIRFEGSGNFSILTQIAKVYSENEYTAGVAWTRATTTATVTTAAPHGFQTGQVLTVSVTSSAAAIVTGAVTITVTGLNTYTFTCLNAGDASGTVTIGPAAGAVRAITTSAAFTQAAVYAGAAATAGDLVSLKKNDILRLYWGTVTTVPPVTRRFWVEGDFFDEA